MKHFTALGTPLALDDDDERDWYSNEARRAERHLASLSPERRAFLEREWNNTNGGAS
ncbi:hypothetical protein [Novosphingobium sp. M1R2S20]|uniref:Uncharacterized protein n=1 Tax=Novosphingobium rhizovicinum TaxID=3228928 RepID=A0ABV3RCS9_9SPHN